MSTVIVKSLNVTRGEKKLFADFSVSFATQKTTAILGASGCGKTTLLHCLAGLLKPDSGTIAFDDNSSKKNRVSYLFQEPRLLPWATLLQNVQIPLERCMHRKAAQEKAEFFLQKTGLIQRKNDLPSMLSGGEKQRTALARAFAFPAPVLLLDEAFQSQDIATKSQLMSLLKNLLQSEKRTAILVSHDIKEALFLADRIIALKGQPLYIAADMEITPQTEHKKITDELTKILQ